MTITLTPEESKNVQVALISLSKQPSTGRTEMVYLMNLMSKFDEQPPESIKTIEEQPAKDVDSHE